MAGTGSGRSAKLAEKIVAAPLGDDDPNLRCASPFDTKGVL